VYSRTKLPITSLAKWYLYKFTAVCALEFPLVSLGNAPATAPFAHRHIPPFVHQTWSSDRFGKTHARELAAFRETNPDLTFLLYDDAAMNAYMREHWGTHEIYQIFLKARYAQVATDVFRYCLIYERGGFYFDISKGLRAPIRSLLGANSTGLITYEHRIWSTPQSQTECKATPFRDNVVAQYGFGFASGHPLLGAVIERICETYPTYQGRVFRKPKDAILSFTGPEMFTEVLREYRSRHQDEALTQAGVDFNGEAIWKLKGAYVRFFSSPPYKHARQDAIVD
jgi:mannosyltransferase OCH1-like enzyme